MARRIQKHSTRLSQAHEAAVDIEFHAGQRVMTIDGKPGRVLFVSPSFAPGVTEYEVKLDNGMGEGTYTPSQLRPVPDAYAGATRPLPPGLLPAGVRVPDFRPMAALETEAAEVHLASDDYPEMGTVLHDRPDPGQEIRVIGLRKTSASHSYGGSEDPRDEDYNGGEQDTGMYWAEPGQQQWMHDNIGPQEEAPPPLLDPMEPASPVLARLAELEEACDLFGSRHHATTINGTQIDDAGDAPQHGTIPRADDPNSYDDQSTEGQGDDRWNQPLPGQDKETLNGATVGMYPEGVEAGGGPGIEVGAFTAALRHDELIEHLLRDHGQPGGERHSPESLHALHVDEHEHHPLDVINPHLHPLTDLYPANPEREWEGGPDASGYHEFVASRVPWTGQERAHLHSWDAPVPDQGGDFVSSADFTNKVPVTQEIEEPAPEIIEQDLRAQASMPAPEDIPAHLMSGHGYYGHEISPDLMQAAIQHDQEHAEGDPRDFEYGGHAHIHVAPYENNLAPWAGTDRPVAREIDHERPWDRGRVMHTLSSHEAAVGEPGWAHHLSDEHGLTPERLADIAARGMRFSHYHDAMHDAGLGGHAHPDVSYGSPFPALPHMEGEEGLQDPDPAAAVYDSRPIVAIDPATWPEETRRRYYSVKQAGVRVQVHGPNDFSLHQADEPEHEHDDDANGLDAPTGKGQEADAEQDQNSLDYGDPKDVPATQDDSLDAPAAAPGAQPSTVPEPNASMTGPDAETERGRGLPPTAWPMTQAPIQQGGPAYTQGTHDQHGRVFPPPPPAPAPGATEGEPGGDGQDPAVPEGDGKKVQLEIKTAAEDDSTADRMRDAYREHMRGESEDHEQRMREQDFEQSQGWEHKPVGESVMRRRERGGGYYKPTDIGRIIGTEPAKDLRGPDDWTDHERRIYSGSLHALAAFEASAASPAFRFEFTASWSDIVAKAKRLRQAGRVRITHASHGMVIGEVGGDHDVYETGIQRAAGHPQTIQHWACGCPWGSFRQNKVAIKGSRLNGRPCSHVMALQFEALSRTRRYDKVDQDLSAADLGVPHQVVVKSMPPWTNGGWAQTWLAPAASLHTATPDEARDWDLSPEERERLWPDLVDGRHIAKSGDADWVEPKDIHAHMIEGHGYPPEWMASRPEERARQSHDFLHDRGWTEDLGHDHHAFGREYNVYGEGLPEGSYYPDEHGGHNQNPRTPHLDRDFHRYQDASEVMDDSGPWEETPEFRAPEWQLPKTSAYSQPAGQVCYYMHAGPCPEIGNSYTAESIRHPRPDNYHSEITYNPAHDPEGYWPPSLATHVLTGYIGRKPVGRLHFSRSDDGQAFRVHMMHSRSESKGVGSAMMDDLSGYVKQNGRWLDHGPRTEDGLRWWASYREPYPELNIHQAHPDEGWKKYFSPMEAGVEDEVNREGAAKLGVGGSYPPPKFDYMQHGDDERDEEWTHARGIEPPAQQATAALLAAGEPLADIQALAVLAGVRVTADQTSAPWGSENVSKHPPQKPYGATEPLNKDQSPASYGFLSAPDPDNWGSIQEGSALQMPLSNQGSLHSALSSPEHRVLVPGAPASLPAGLKYPSIADQTDQGTFNYTDRANTAGPSTAMEARDPQGIRMEESLGEHCVSCGDPENEVLGPLRREDNGACYHGECWAKEISQPRHRDDGIADMVYRDPSRQRPHDGPLDPVFGGLDDDAAEYRRHLVTHHGQPDYEGLAQDWGKHLRDHEDAVRARDIGEPLEGYTGFQPHPYQELAHERRHMGGEWPDAMRSQGELKPADEPDAALDPDGLTAEGAAVGHAPEPMSNPDMEDHLLNQHYWQPNDIEAATHRSPSWDEYFNRLVKAHRRSHQEPGYRPSEEFWDHQAAADGTIGGGDAGTGETSQEPADVAGLGEFGASAMGDQSVAEGLTGGAQLPSPVTQEPGMGSGDEYLTPDDQSIQTIGQQQWSGGGADSDEAAVPAGEPQGDTDSIVASFQRSAAARQYGESSGPGINHADIARAARDFLKTADVLPAAEADELISEGKGTRARNLGMLRLEGTHYEDEDATLAARGVDLDDYDDDVISV